MTQALLRHIEHKVKELFADHYVPAHSFDHAEAVAERARQIANEEQARHPLLCELAGWLHDIGRVTEHFGKNETRSHHELSYEMLRGWFRDDRAFDELTANDKLELLYAVRYHWNNMADDFDTAWILRDADKLDGFGERGMQRFQEFHADDETRNRAFRNLYDCYYWLHTPTAKRIVEEERLMEQVNAAYKEFLKNKIERISP